LPIRAVVFFDGFANPAALIIVNKVDDLGARSRRHIKIPRTDQPILGVPLVVPAVLGQGLIAVGIEQGLKAETRDLSVLIQRITGVNAGGRRALLAGQAVAKVIKTV